MTTKTYLATALTVISLGIPAFATNYSGNGNTGFGGPVGTGSLTLTDDGTTIFGTVTKGANTFNDVLVIYIDSVTGGANSTAGYTDAADGLRKAISGYDGGNRSTLNFASGFLPDYVLALGPSSDNFGGEWSLSSGGSHGFLSSVSLSPTGNNNSASYTFSFSLASIGISAGQSFGLFGTYISNTGYRSDESVAGIATGVQGYNTFTQTAFSTYTTTAVPEPTTMALAGSGLALLYVLRRRK